MFKKYTLMLALLLSASFAITATAQLVNGGFETGDSTGWTESIPTGGFINYVVSGSSENPAEGTYFAHMKTDGPGSFTTLSQPLGADLVGMEISGYTFFLDAEFPVFGCTFLDSMSVDIMAGATLVANVFYTQHCTDGVTVDNGSLPWTLWSYTFDGTEPAGPYSVQARIVNIGDSLIDSTSGVDGLELDLCPNTVADTPSKHLGKNRWMWDGQDWVTNANRGGPDKDFTMDDTQGCSCEQILDVLVDKTDKPFDGHYKFGCSSSVVEEWIAGLYFMETVEVPATDADGVDSDMTLKSTENYQFMAYGVANATPDGPGIPFDAKYSVNTIAGEDPSVDADWTDDVTGYTIYGPQLLDLHVDTTFINWGTFNPAHFYWYGMPGTGSPVNFWIYDLGDNSNNRGSLFVDIFVELW